MSRSSVPALSRGLHIIEIVSRKGEVGFNNLQEIFALNPSSLNRLLQVLLEKGYLVKNQKGKYELGLKIFTLKDDSIWELLIIEGYQVLKDISNKFKVSALLLGFAQKQIIALEKVAYKENVAMQKKGELILENFIAPWGIIYLSQLTKKERKEFYENNLSDIESINYQQFKSYIEFVNNNGYADDKGYILNYMQRLAVPIKYDNQIIGAIGIGSFKQLLDKKKIKNLIQFTKEKSKEISKNLREFN